MLSFTGSTLTFSIVSSTDMNLVSSTAYTITVRGEISSTAFKTTTFSFFVKSPCEIATISLGTNVINNFDYKLNSGAVTK